MPNTFTQIYIQIVFAVEWRQNLIQPDHKEEVHKYITGIVRNKGQKLIEINTMPDHLHMLHGKTSFKKEYMTLLRKFDVVFEPATCLTFRRSVMKRNANYDISPRWGEVAEGG